MVEEERPEMLPPASSGQTAAVVDRVTADGLPEGWIKELKSRKGKGSTKKDPYYIDPKSGYVFRSLKDALRYIETGDIRSCVMKPKKRSIDDVHSLQKESQDQSGDESSKKPDDVQPQTRKQKKRRRIVLHKKRSAPKKPNPDPKPEVKPKVVLKETEPKPKPESRRVKSRKERPTPVRASPRLAAIRAINDNASDDAEMGAPVDGSDPNLGTSTEPELQNVNSNPRTPTEAELQNVDPNLGTSTEPKLQNVDLNPRNSNKPELKNMDLNWGISPEPEPELEKMDLNPETSAKPDLQKMDSNQGISTEPEPKLQKVDLNAGTLAEPDPQNQAPTEEAGASGKVEMNEFAGIETMMDDRPGSPFSSLFGNSWQDPCLEFAFKTLTSDMGDGPPLDFGMNKTAGGVHSEPPSRPSDNNKQFMDDGLKP